jgi:hypothetical protein
MVPNENKKNKLSLPTAILKKRLNQFIHGDWDEMIQTFLNNLEASPVKPTTPPPSTTNDGKLGDAVANLAYKHQYQKAMKLLKSTGMAPLNEASMELLKAKHPEIKQAIDPFQEDAKETEPITISAERLEKDLRTAKRHTGMCYSGWHTEYLRALLPTQLTRGEESPHRQPAFQLLAEVVSRLASGLAPPEIHQSMVASILIALNKPGGGLRPITIGESITRLTGRSLASLSKEEVLEYLGNIQFGVATPGGVEIATNKLKLLLAMNPTKACLNTDVKNAFNEISRKQILSVVWEKFPSLYRYVYSCYKSRAFLSAGEKSLWSSEGARQGDSIASILFTIALQPILLRLKSKYKNLEIIAIADDVSFFDDQDTLLEVFTDYSTWAKEIGLEVQPSKSKLYSSTIITSTHQWTSQAVEIVPPDSGIKFGGVFIGSEPYIKEQLEKKLQEVLIEIENLAIVKNLMVRYQLLKYCVVPKINHLLRTTAPTREIRSVLEEYDEKFMKKTTELLEIKFGNKAIKGCQQRLFTLPIGLGGLAISSALLTAPAAFTAAWANLRVLDLTSKYPTICKLIKDPKFKKTDLYKQINEAMSMLDTKTLKKTLQLETNKKLIDQKNLTPRDIILITEANRYVSEEPESKVRIQKALMKHRYKQLHLELMDSGLPDRLRAKMLSNAQKEASAYLHTTSLDPSLRFDNQQFKFTIALRYMLPLPGAEILPGRCWLCHKHLMDPEGNHLTECGSNLRNLLTRKHDALNIKEISQLIKTAGGQVFIEPTNITAEDRKHPDGLIYGPGIPDSVKGYYDISFISNSSNSILPGAATIANHATMTRETAKEIKFTAKCHQRGISFWPFIFDTSGAWGNTFKEWFSLICTTAGKNTTITPNDFRSKYTHRLSTVIIRHITDMAIDRMRLYDANHDETNAEKKNRRRHLSMFNDTTTDNENDTRRPLTNKSYSDPRGYARNPE